MGSSWPEIFRGFLSLETSQIPVTPRTHQQDVMQVSQNQLSELTGKDRKTIRRLLSNLAPTNGPHRAKLYESKIALETLYYGNNGNGEFVTTAEAVRRLTIAKEKEIVLDMEIKRGSRVPLEDVAETANQIFMGIAGTIKAYHNKVLTTEVINEIFTGIRDWSHSWRRQADKAERCDPTLWRS